MRQSPDPSAISHSSLKYNGKEMQMDFFKNGQIGFWQMYKEVGVDISDCSVYISCYFQKDEKYPLKRSG